MEYYSNYETGKTNELIKTHQKFIDDLFNAGKFSEIENYLMSLAIKTSEKNVNKDGKETPSFDNIEGGPFAAVIVKKDDNRPVIIGVGANHVVPENNPSAHGEMSAIRDATARQGYSDLSGATMYTSCECCPQCLSSSISAGIGKIIYANDRFQAAEIGFSDEEQYRYMLDMFSCMSNVDNSDFKKEILEKLENYSAMILDKNNSVICRINIEENSPDPMKSLPSMQAVINACGIVGGFHLPEGCKLVSRKIPHPASFITADWARIGRIRDAQNPNDPSLDKFEKNPQSILFIDNEFEEMIVKDYNGQTKINLACNELLNSYIQQKFNITIERTNNPENLTQAYKVFEIWKNIVNCNKQAKY